MENEFQNSIKSLISLNKVEEALKHALDFHSEIDEGKTTELIIISGELKELNKEIINSQITYQEGKRQLKEIKQRILILCGIQFIGSGNLLKYLEKCILNIKNLIREQLKNKMFYKKLGWATILVSLICIILFFKQKGYTSDELVSQQYQFNNLIFAIAAITLRLVLIPFKEKTVKAILFFENNVARIESLVIDDLENAKEKLDEIMNLVFGK